MAKSTGKTRPWSASPVTSPEARRRSAPSTTSSPMREAATTMRGERVDPETIAPMTIPGRTAWDMASTSIAWRRSTRSVPGRAQVRAVVTARTATETMKGISGLPRSRQ